ncbi:galectin-5-like isoform X2 [Pecten maximus]|nr:galectin-5-like isoform X2 [Pecten maximus]XP_033749984.1 galectin-5-like isoform X2 [Pecten maximus]
MTPGKIVFISGITNGACHRFTVNLKCGSVTGEDIALHFDVRVKILGEHHKVVRNSHIGGHWGREEREIPYFPFKSDANVDIMILAEQDRFKIAVNNKHFAEYRHRLRPLNRINTLSVTGDIRLTQVRFQ